ncbi:Ppx/GppA phosphatase family protein [Halomonas piscis]|uniref:Ppx/GppA phosphatase family protein n=1 Tax=Halomonas piscis TaxID=3031727 RepID=UPI0028995B4F|nr:Ppx/GppA phosphatase family protein [Halomonas piscis]
MPKDTPFSAAAGRAVSRHPGRAARRLAAIDLGSNSFHLLVASVIRARPHIVTRRGVKVQLAAGLDARGNLDRGAMQRGLECLEQFAAMLHKAPCAQLRIVGTSALRDAGNRHVFLDRAAALLGQPVEVISGREEARLIYLGAGHAREFNGRRLLVDVGGGSSECVIGEGMAPQLLESLAMGCVTFSRRFFPGGVISSANIQAAEQAALERLASVQAKYRRAGWDEAVGTSGTLKSVARVLYACGDSREKGLITRPGLEQLRARVLRYRHLDELALKGLKANRAGIFPAGIAIVSAIFRTFDLQQLRFVDGALREGMLHDMLSALPDAQAQTASPRPGRVAYRGP